MNFDGQPAVTAHVLPPALIEHLARGRVLAIGAHPDDLALSAGGLLRQLARHGGVTVVSVFTRSRWAPALPRRHRDAITVSSQRAWEDRHYCRLLGARRVAVGAPDASLRGYSARSERLGPRAGDHRAREVPRAVAELVRRAGADTVLCPLGLGGHVDHLLVAEAAAQARPAASLWLFYEDLPYAADLALAAIRRRVARLAPQAWPGLVDISAGLATKLADVSLYRSQRLSECLETLARHARRVASGRGYAERVWVAGQL